MAVGEIPFGPMAPVAGCRVAAVAAGVRRPGRDDVVLFEFAPNSAVAGVFTRNAFCAAPVALCRERVDGRVRALLINSGNANACTGEPGLAAARVTCRAVADALGCDEAEVLPFSTGVIGEPLPADRIAGAVPGLVAALSPDGWESAARAIMTTDTLPKAVSRQLLIAGRTVTISGITKGAGMIRPDMATMLAFVVTDAAIDRDLLARWHRQLVDRSFNRVTVDGDTSTNDSAILVATGAAGNPPLCSGTEGDSEQFFAALLDVYRELAQAIIRDAEGATKFVTVAIDGGADQAECLAVGYAIAESPLVKTALFASDPNWGRIVAAIGYAGVEGLDVTRVGVWLDDVRIVHRGQRDPDYREELGAAVFARSEFTVRVDLGRGDASDQLWTCDFSYDYVRINADYRS